jgi:hypothetical protein
MPVITDMNRRLLGSLEVAFLLSAKWPFPLASSDHSFSLEQKKRTNLQTVLEAEQNNWA